MGYRRRPKDGARFASWRQTATGRVTVKLPGAELLRISASTATISALT
jgi:hypothetical protein